ncbi:MAG: divalent cation transporter [Thermoplasmata archaeon HGW-Thermoplasmata-1]|nr:MAG: divalent cation transporter [Thermoplasmata archaeon HGW-Thermoplasmata-1]
MRSRDVLLQSFPLLLICGIGQIFTGSILGNMEGILSRTPGLLVLIPAIIGLRGNINAALGARLGSATHLGLIDAKHIWGKELGTNVNSSLILSVIMSLMVGLIAYATCRIFGVAGADASNIILIALIAGTVSGVILALLTVGIILLAFRFSLDPDNVTGPALATFGDIITMLCIFGAAFLLGGA